jgi:hypothetical protein
VTSQDAADADRQVQGEVAGGDGCHGRRPIGVPGDAGAEAVAELPERGVEIMVVGWLADAEASRTVVGVMWPDSFQVREGRRPRG